VRWNQPPARRALLAFAAGSGVGLGTQLFSVLLQRWIPKSLPIEQYFKTPSAAYALAIFGILIAPVVEELFFRGFLYPALARPLGAGVSMVLTAGGFALIHAEQLALAWAPLLLLFTVGMILTAVRAKTKSVAVCVLMHMGYNFTLFLLLYIATQGFRHMERG
jgi:membrane protease YdiL (CAAX protease family)